MNLTLGQFIEKLKLLKPEADITFDFGLLYPDCFDSYRGYYKDLALGFTQEFNHTTAKTLLREAKSCIGRSFYGCKGGTYFMDKDTLLWVANYGISTTTAIVYVLDLDYHAVIITKYIED